MTLSDVIFWQEQGKNSKKDTRMHYHHAKHLQDVAGVM